MKAMYNLNTNKCQRILSRIRPKFECRKCQCTEYYKSTNTQMICKNCKNKYSITNGTLFHWVRFGLLKAFRIVIEDYGNDFTSSVTSISKKYKITRRTAWLFLKKIRSRKDEVKELVTSII